MSDDREDVTFDALRKAYRELFGAEMHGWMLPRVKDDEDDRQWVPPAKPTVSITVEPSPRVYVITLVDGTHFCATENCMTPLRHDGTAVVIDGQIYCVPCGFKNAR